MEKNATILLGSITSNAITHNADGSKTISVSASSPDLAQASGYGPYSGSASGTITLTTIPRASSVTCADGNIESSTTININRASSSFTHTLIYTFGNLSETIATKTSDTSIGWTIPSTFYAQIPNAKSGKGTITCETYNGNTLIGTSTCPFNAIVLEENSKPTITATIVDTNTKTTALTGDKNKLVKYFSNAKVTMKATAKNSATIKSQKVTCADGKSSTSATATLNAIESGTFNLYCTDSRGFAGANTVKKEIINYIKLAITSLTIVRESSTSNTIKISLKGNYFNGSFGSVSNTLTLKWRYRLQGGTWSSYTTITATKSGNTFSYSGTLGTNFNYKQAYEFEVVAQDKLMTSTLTRPVTAGIPLIDMWKDNLNINGKLRQNNITIIDLIYPVGSIYMSINNTNPQTLFGGTWEQIKDRFLLACGSTYSNGTTGGSKEHQHLLPIAINNAIDNWEQMHWNNAFEYGTNTITSPNYSKINNTPVGTSKTLHQLKTQSVSNLPPYLAVYIWKRTK